RLEHRRVAEAGGIVERRAAGVVGEIGIVAAPQHHLDILGLVLRGGVGQRVPVGKIDGDGGRRDTGEQQHGAQAFEQQATRHPAVSSVLRSGPFAASRAASQSSAAATLPARAPAGAGGRRSITTGSPRSRAATSLASVAPPPLAFATSTSTACRVSIARSSARPKGPRPSTSS